MKKLIIVLSMVMVGIPGLIFAAGVQEEETFERNGYFMSDDADSIEITGKVELSDGEAPRITSGGNTYVLMFPWYLFDDVDVADGDTVTVTGYERPSPRYEYSEDEVFLHLASAVIDGEEFEIDIDSCGGMMGHMENDRSYGHGGYGMDRDDVRRGGRGR